MPRPIALPTNLPEFLWVPRLHRAPERFRLRPRRGLPVRGEVERALTALLGRLGSAIRAHRLGDTLRKAVALNPSRPAQALLAEALTVYPTDPRWGGSTVLHPWLALAREQSAVALGWAEREGLPARWVVPPSASPARLCALNAWIEGLARSAPVRLGRPPAWTASQKAAHRRWVRRLADPAFFKKSPHRHRALRWALEQAVELHANHLLRPLLGLVRSWPRHTLPIHAAVAAHNVPAARALLDAGADINEPLFLDSEGVWDEGFAERLTPLHVAVADNTLRASGRLRHARRLLDGTLPWLLRHGLDVNARSGEDSTVLHEESVAFNPRAVAGLVAAGADLAARNAAGETPLMSAVRAAGRQRGRGVHSALRLLAAGADWSQRRHDGSTLLHNACRGAHAPTVRWLLQKRLAVDARDHKGATPLITMASAFCKDVPTLKVLLAHGASLTACDRAGANVFVHAFAPSVTLSPPFVLALLEAADAQGLVVDTAPLWQGLAEMLDTPGMSIPRQDAMLLLRTPWRWPGLAQELHRLPGDLRALAEENLLTRVSLVAAPRPASARVRM